MAKIRVKKWCNYPWVVVQKREGVPTQRGSSGHTCRSGTTLPPPWFHKISQNYDICEIFHKNSHIWTINYCYVHQCIIIKETFLCFVLLFYVLIYRKEILSRKSGRFSYRLLRYLTRGQPIMQNFRVCILWRRALNFRGAMPNDHNM